MLESMKPNSRNLSRRLSLALVGILALMSGAALAGDADIVITEVMNNPLVLGDDITIGHGCILHGCTIEDRCLIGMGSVVLDGAVIGPDAIIGAGSVVKQGDVIPSGTLYLGIPARYKRDLSPEEIEAILKSAEHYAEYGREYLKRSI